MKNIILLQLFIACACMAQTTRVLIVGDSWAQQQFEDGVHAQVFMNHGLSDINVDGTNTARSGTEAADWVQPDQLQLIEDALIINPSIDTVQLTLGGNDFLNGWTANLTSQQELALQQQILANLTTIVDFILAQNASIEVVLSFYDYPNFVDTIDGFTAFICRDLHTELGSPSPSMINTAAQQFEQIYAQLASTNSRVHHVSHFGLMQNKFGVPSIPLPGDVSLPSPLAAMRVTLTVDNCFHLNAGGYTHIVENLYENYYQARFDTVFKSGFE